MGRDALRIADALQRLPSLDSDSIFYNRTNKDRLAPWWRGSHRDLAYLLMLGLVLLWVLRMTTYLVHRNWGHGEDARYTKLRSWVEHAVLERLCSGLQCAGVARAFRPVWSLKGLSQGIVLSLCLKAPGAPAQDR